MFAIDNHVTTHGCALRIGTEKRPDLPTCEPIPNNTLSVCVCGKGYVEERGRSSLSWLSWLVEGMNLCVAFALPVVRTETSSPKIRSCSTAEGNQ